MQDWRAKHLDIPELQRKGRYNQLSFTIELIRELAGITDYAIVSYMQYSFVFHSKKKLLIS